MPEGYDNSKVINWAKGTNLAAIKAEIAALNIKHSPKSTNKLALASNLTVTTRERNGLVDKISYKMPRSAIFLHKGVGNGTPISKAGQTKRIAKKFFDIPTERNMPELLDIVAENDLTFIINSLTLK